VLELCLQELGGSAPSELMGELVAAKRATALGASLKAAGRELSDDCKVRGPRAE